MDYSKENFAFRSIDKLKETSCKSCIADGNVRYGTCEKCLRNQAWNKEYVETHLFIADDELQNYHCSSCGHDTFKRTVYRKKNEHPYLYYGIEIEVGFGYDDVQVFQDEDYDDWSPTSQISGILEEFSRITGGMFIYEKDGSVENGVELISRPTSYAKWVDKDTVKKLKDGFQYLREQGAFMEQPAGNGMHIHISTKFFERGEIKRENYVEAYKDLDWIFQFFQPEIEKIGGREYTGYCQSKIEQIKRTYGIGDNNRSERYWNVEMKVQGKMKKGGEIPVSGHRFALELSNNTIEARVFASTIDYKQVLANIEFMRNLAHAVREEEIDGKTFNQIMHTKDNLYLDNLVQDVRKKCYKRKEEFNLEKVAENEMEIK